MALHVWCLLSFVALVGVAEAQQPQPIYWKKDHIYNGASGAEIAIVTPLPSDQTAPTAPTGLTVSNITATSAQLSWLQSTDSGGSGLAGYKIYRQQGSGASLPIGTVDANTLSFVDQGPLLPSTTYTYTAVAFDMQRTIVRLAPVSE
jgi:hypothetical protein